MFFHVLSLKYVRPRKTEEFLWWLVPWRHKYWHIAQHNFFWTYNSKFLTYILQSNKKRKAHFINIISELRSWKPKSLRLPNGSSKNMLLLGLGSVWNVSTGTVTIPEFWYGWEDLSLLISILIPQLRVFAKTKNRSDNSNVFLKIF